MSSVTSEKTLEKALNQAWLCIMLNKRKQREFVGKFLVDSLKKEGIEKEKLINIINEQTNKLAEAACTIHTQNKIIEYLERKIEKLIKNKTER